MSQGIEVINQPSIPYANTLLLIAAVIMVIGLFLIAFNFNKTGDENKKPATN